MSEFSATDQTLDGLNPFLVAANVRRVLDTSRFLVGPGVGQVGDLVIGRVVPPPGQKIPILDQTRVIHRVAEPQRVVAVLGPRDSSTHVCATIPAGGLRIDSGTAISWVAGESGIVGCLEREAPTESIHAAESSVGFICDGLIFDGQHQPATIADFAVRPQTCRLSTPLVLVAATSSESGKTVLAGALIRRLSEAGMRVGALKVTGTGGVLDSLHHEQSGAAAVLDNVDAGLISTHCDPGEFCRKIPLIFRQLENFGVDVIVAELGGDIVSANNPTLFRIGELMCNTSLLLVISNDALAAAGVEALNATRLGFPVSGIRHFTSPFRNHAGMSRRMALAGIATCYDPRSDDDLTGITIEVMNIIIEKRTDAPMPA